MLWLYTLNSYFVIMNALKSVPLFILAGICEIGGGYLIWQWLRENRSIWFGIAGAIIMVLYGVVATWQRSDFVKVYATYGGFFIALSLVWAYYFDHFRPTRYDIVGTVIALIGVCIIYYSPR